MHNYGYFVVKANKNPHLAGVKSGIFRLLAKILNLI
jgi:hypothetical protein